MVVNVYHTPSVATGKISICKIYKFDLLWVKHLLFSSTIINPKQKIYDFYTGKSQSYSKYQLITNLHSVVSVREELRVNIVNMFSTLVREIRAGTRASALPTGTVASSKK